MTKSAAAKRGTAPDWYIRGSRDELRQLAVGRSDAKDLQGTAVGDIPLFQQFVRIGGGVSPNLVAAIIREADIGRIGRLVDLMHEFRQKCGHLQSVLQRRESATASLDVQVSVEEDALARDKKLAKILERALRKARGFREMVAHLSGESCLFGFAFVEVIWAYDGKYLIPVEFRRISNRRFGYRTSDGKLLFDPDGYGEVNANGVDLIAEHAPGKFVFIQRRINGDVPIREGLARVLVWLAALLSWDIRDWGMLAEIGWKPIRKGGYGKGANDKDIRDLDTALRNFMASGWVRYNKDTTEITVEWPKGTGGVGKSVHKEFADFINAEISKAVLCGTLTTQEGDRGARSLGEVHSEGLEEVTDLDETAVSEALTDQLSRPFFAMNGGGTAEVGRVSLPHEEALDLMQFSAAIKNFKDAGLAMPAAHVRDIAGIPDPEEGEELVGGGKYDPNADPEEEDPNAGEDKGAGKEGSQGGSGKDPGASDE